MNRLAQTCIAATLVVGIAGCAGTATFDPGPRFDASNYATWTQAGNGTINGQAFVHVDADDGGFLSFGDSDKQRTITCAGATISAMPATPFFADYLATAKDEGTLPEPPPAMQALIHTATCDASGHFSFHGLAPARWLLSTGEGWTLDDDRIGAWISTKVTVNDHQPATVTLSPKS